MNYYRDEATSSAIINGNVKNIFAVLGRTAEHLIAKDTHITGITQTVSIGGIRIYKIDWELFWILANLSCPDPVMGRHWIAKCHPNPNLMSNTSFKETDFTLGCCSP